MARSALQKKDLEYSLQTFILHTVPGYGNTFQLGYFYAKLMPFSSVTIFSLVTEEKSSVTVASVEEMNRFYI